jgi:hypothetical protein
MASRQTYFSYVCDILDEIRALNFKLAKIICIATVKLIIYSTEQKQFCDVVCRLGF